MLKIIYRNCADIDAHKKTNIVIIVKTNKQDITE